MNLQQSTKKYSYRGIAHAALATLLLMLTGCASIPDEHYRCLDIHRQPLPGVLFICTYDFPNREAYAIEVRYSGKDGWVHFVEDAVQPRAADGLRSMLLVYSEKMHLGVDHGLIAYPGDDRSVGDKYISSDSTTFVSRFMGDEADPVGWYYSLVRLAGVCNAVKRREGGLNVKGIERVEEIVFQLFQRESAAFLARHGDTAVPTEEYMEYALYIMLSNLNSAEITAPSPSSIRKLYRRGEPIASNTGIKFREIIPLLK